MGWMSAAHAALAKINEEHFSLMLDGDRLHGESTTFMRTVETDGTPVCVYFKQPKKHARKPLVLFLFIWY